MAIKWKHWCLFSCGKQVVHYRIGMKTCVFKCQICGAVFNKEQIEKYKNNEYTEKELKRLLEVIKNEQNICELQASVKRNKKEFIRNGDRSMA